MSTQIMPEAGSAQEQTFLLLDMIITIIFTIELLINLFANRYRTMEARRRRGKAGRCKSKGWAKTCEEGTNPEMRPKAMSLTSPNV